MSTVDQLLIELCREPYPAFESIKEERDRRILLSLFRQLSSGNFLTENQGNLLVKIFKENLPALAILDPKYEIAATQPTWSRSFRVIEQIRKIYIGKPGTDSIVIEFTFNKRIKQKILELNQLVDGNVTSISQRQYSVSLTEKNIHTLVKMFKGYNFDIDQQIMDFYQEISEILENKNNVFDIFSIADQKILSKITAEVGAIDRQNVLLLNDRKIRYQYQISEKNPENSLTEKLAARQAPRVFINSQQIALNEIIASLKELKRLPLLVVFDHYSPENSWEMLKALRASVESNELSKVGIYFRFDSGSNSGMNFNSLIGVSNFNQHLTTETEIVGIANGKLPKFMLKTDWYPKSVLNLTNSFKHNRTSFYCDAVDLIINYGETLPLGGDINAIV